MTLPTFHVSLKERKRERDEGKREGERERKTCIEYATLTYTKTSLRNIRRRIALTIHKHREDRWWEEE